MTLEHFGFFRKCLRNLAVLCVVVLEIAMKLGREMGLTLIIYNRFPWGSEFVLCGRILRSQPSGLFTLRRLGSDRLPGGPGEISRQDIYTEGNYSLQTEKGYA